MNNVQTRILSYRAPGSMRQLDLRDGKDHNSAAKIRAFMDTQAKLGIDYSPAMLHKMQQVYRDHFESATGPRPAWMDAAPTPTFNPSNIGNLVQFLQEWFPGVIGINTAPRKINNLVGVTTAGRWENEEVVFRIAEPTAVAQTYTDAGAVPLASYNPSFERRTMYRGELGFETGILAQERAALNGFQYATLKREACVAGLAIQLNAIGFYGIAGQSTYGLLDDIGLGPYITVASKAAGGTQWTGSTTFNEIVGDLITGFTQFRVQTQGLVDPKKDKLKLVLPVAKMDRLSTVNTLGTLSVLEWLKGAYPNCEVDSAPEFGAANAGQDVFYIYSLTRGEQTNISSSDGNAVWHQVVPVADRLIGVQPRAKGILEDHSSATAGTICVAPFCVVRYAGI